ncbi:glycosyltransferase [Synechococcus sp. AH-601-B19]|nr:glycosyltransferase [Synechococcus sp. AH-601-B19]
MKAWLYWNDKDILNTAPYLNQKCLDRWQQLNHPKNEIILLDRETAMKQEPRFRDLLKNCRYKRTHAAESDLLRLILLERHGGIWIDSSVYPIKPLSNYLDKFVGNKSFFAYRFFPRSISLDVGSRELASWFLVAKEPSLYIITKWLERFENEFVNSTSWKYFTLHDVLCRLYDSDEEIKNVIDGMNQISEKSPHSVLHHGVENRVAHPLYKRPIYRMKGDGKYELKYLETIGSSTDWREVAQEATNLIHTQALIEAKAQILSGLEKFPNQLNLLTIATDVYRASGDREKSLEYSELLIAHHPDNPPGYIRSAQDLVALKRFHQAREKVEAGLEKFPNQLNLLTIATDVYRASGDREKSLEYSELLIAHHPDNPPGYIRSAQDLVALKRFDQAREKVEAGLEKFPNQLNLLTIATDVYRASGDREKSLEHATLFAIHHSERWIINFIHIGKCAGTSLNLFLKRHINCQEIHMKQPEFVRTGNEKYIIWIRNPIDRFVSAFNHSKSIIDFDVSLLNGELPTLENCLAPAKISRKLKTGNAFDSDYESLFKHFEDASALAESITSSNQKLKFLALQLMTHPAEHIYKGIGWHLDNGKFVKEAQRSIIKIGTFESIDEDINELKQLLNIPKSDMLTQVRINKSNLPCELTATAERNIRHFYKNTDYAAIKEMKACNLIPDNLYE